MFAGAKDTLIAGGNFYVTNNPDIQAKGINLLRDKVASGAFHNSAERYDPPKCHPGTREAIIKEIMVWIEAIGKREFFLWMYGPAGAGKSAIAQTIAELCDKSGLLAASFFFSRTAAGRNDATFLIPTLAYQLTLSIPEMLEQVSSAIEKDPLIFTRSVEFQLQALILRPLRLTFPTKDLTKEQSKSYPQLIIIDGLDECADAKTQRYILATLSSSLQPASVPLIFLISSRPEQEIRDVFNRDTVSSLTRRLVLDDHYQPDADIRKFLSSKLEEIRKTHPLAFVLPPSWPSNTDIDRLVQKSSGQFIYASTVVKFVQSLRHRPTDRLDVIFGLINSGNQTPFAELDILYTFIFASVDNIDAVLDVFMFLLLFSDKNAPKYAPAIVERFWAYQNGDLQVILADLHSVISVPSAATEGDRLRIFHASLGDFLMDKSRSGRFFIDASKAHARMAQYCLKNMSQCLPWEKEIKDRDGFESLLGRSFMQECVKAYPTKELLEELHPFRFAQFLDSATLLDESIVSLQLCGLFDWLQQQCSPTHSPGCLCTRYMREFDRHLLGQLSDFPSSDPYYQHLLTAFTLRSCTFAHVNFCNVMEESNSYTGPTNNAGISLFRTIERYPKYRSLLVQIFTDPIRSGAYYRDKSKYMDLVVKTLAYLCTPENTFQLTLYERRSADALAIKIVLATLSLFPRDPQFVKLVRANPLRENINPRDDAMAEIEAYIKDYETQNPDLPAALSPKTSKKHWLAFLFRQCLPV